MALTYKTDVITLNAANTDFTILTASASSTLVKNISWIHDDHNTNIILSITKSGGSKISIGEYAATANTSTKIWTDVLPLGANDVLHLQSDHISSTDVGYCVISYVEDTANVAGQSIGVHTDVSISGITDGQVLEWNNSATQFEPATVSGGATDTDGLTEGSTNLYFTDARVAANSAVTANTAKVGITTQQASDITTNNAKTGITSGQASAITANTAKISYTDASAVAANTAKTGITAQQASDITANNAKVSYTDASAVTANTAKVGITTQQTSDITTNNAKVGITAQQASDITANNAKTGITAQQASDITANNAKIATVVDDTSPQLGGNLDVQASEIDTSTTNGNITVTPNGTGVLEVKGDTNDAAIQLNCNQNLHGVKIQSPPHSASASYTLVLPNDTGTSGQVMTTDGSGNLSFTTVSSGGANTNLANTNLTADNSRTYDQDGNDLTINPNGGQFEVNDSSGPPSGAEIVVGQGELQLQGLTYPASDGTAGQVLTTNGSGSLSFTTVSGGGGGSGGIGTADQTLTADRTIDTNGYNLDIELDSSGTADTFKIHDGTHDLFQVDTGTTGTIFSVNDVSGLPKLTVDDSNGVTIDKFKQIKLEKPATDNFSYQGDVVYIGTGSTTQGELCYYKSDGEWAAADANATGTAGGVLLAIALGTDPDADGMLLRGMFTLDHDPGTIADELYVSTTAGDVTGTAPSGSGDIVRVIGYCLDSTNGQIWFNPSNDWIELT